MIEETLVRVSLMLPETDVAWVDEQAKQAKKSRASVIRDLIRQGRKLSDMEGTKRIGDKTLAEIKELYRDMTRQDEWSKWLDTLTKQEVVSVLEYIKTL